MRSELARHSVLLSSSTVFMFSIHTASTGPSKMIHFRFSLPSFRQPTQSLTSLGTMPSFHSLVCRLNSPYSSPAVMDFGFSTRRSTTL